MTAVEYLIEKLSEPVLKLSWYRDELYEKAKEMEKQQIMDAIEYHIDLFKETEISDQDIEDIAWEKFITDSGRFGFISGAKWYREQLKNKQ